MADDQERGAEPQLLADVVGDGTQEAALGERERAITLNLSVGKDGKLRDERGRCYGQLTALSLTLEGDLGLKDVLGDQLTLESRNAGSTEAVVARAGRAKRPKWDDDPDLKARVESLWGYWCSIRSPRRAKMGVSTGRQLAKALQIYSEPQLRAAMDALMASDWHADRNLQTLSTIFATRPGGPTFEDQVDTWIERADSKAVVNTGASQGAIDAAKDTVRRTWALRFDSSVAREHYEDAMRLLVQHGISVADDNGRPVFS